MTTKSQRDKLKQSPELYKLTVRIDVNTRAIAKVVSAAEYLGVPEPQAWPLYACLESLIAERRGMRQAMWQELDRRKYRQ